MAVRKRVGKGQNHCLTLLTCFTDRKTNHRNFSGFGAGSGSRAVRVKNEGDESGPSRSGGLGGGGGGGDGGSSSIKREDGGIVESSEDEEDQEFPRRDIDLIEISDDEDGADVNERPSRSALPIRITRKEHQRRHSHSTQTLALRPHLKIQQRRQVLVVASLQGSDQVRRHARGRARRAIWRSQACASPSRACGKMPTTQMSKSKPNTPATTSKCQTPNK